VQQIGMRPRLEKAAKPLPAAPVNERSPLLGGMTQKKTPSAETKGVNQQL
jgi:hypothetical protein